MYRYNTGQFKEKTYHNPLKKYELQTKELKNNRYGIPKPIKSNENETNFSQTTNFQRRNKYILQNNPEQNNFPYNTHTREIYTIKKVPCDQNFLVESYPQPETDRYNYNNEVMVYQRKISRETNYNNNSFHFIKQNNNSNNNSQIYERKINDYNNNQIFERKGNDFNNYQIYERRINDNKNNYKNQGFKMIRENTPNIIQRKPLHYNYSSKMLCYNKYNKDFNIQAEKTYTKDLYKNNYKVVDIKHKNSENTLNMTTPNNTKMHTIVYTNRKSKDIPLPQKLFNNTEKHNSTRGIYIEENRNIPEEINEYFTKRNISYRDRGKYVNAVLLLQTTYRSFKKNGKIKINYIKKYVKLYRAINALEELFVQKDKYWKIFKDKFYSYGKKNSAYIKRKAKGLQISINKSTKVKEKLNGGQMPQKNGKEENQNQSVLQDKPIARSQSRDIINVEKLLKEKEDLEKRLNDIMKENSMLKKINLSNKDLLFKNIALNEQLEKNEEKTKKLEMENEKYLNEFSKTKDKYSKIEGEVADVNMKLKITYLKFIIEKKQMKRKLILKKYLKKYKEIVQKIKAFEKKKEDENNNKKLMIETTQKMKKEELQKKRNKLLLELFYYKEKERTRFMHSCFSQFYYKGLINQYKFRRTLMLGQLQSNSKNQNNDAKKKEEEEKKRKEEEESKKKEEEERMRIEEEEKKKREEEEEKKKREEEKKKEEELKKEEDLKYKEQMRKMNKLNMERRKKLKKLLQEEKQQNLDIKRRYFKIYHFKAFFFASHVMTRRREKSISKNNNDNDDDNAKNEEEIKKKEEEENKLKQEKEREELIRIRQNKLQAIFFKKDRKNIIKKKNIMQRWNLTAKVISLGPKKKLRGKSKKRGVSKKAKNNEEENNKKVTKMKNLIPTGREGGNSEDEKENNNEDEKNKDKEDEKKNEQ